MKYESDDYLSRHFQTSTAEVNHKVEELAALSTPPNSPNKLLYQEMLLTVARMAQSDRNRWDAKILLQTMREMESAFSLLDKFKRRRKVTVFGSGRTPEQHPLYQVARELGQALSEQDLMVITGAGGGIMAAAHAGAGPDNSLGLNIALPFEQGANATVEGTGNLLTFHFFFLRKLFFVKEADAVVLCPGGFGTMDEALEVLTLIQTGKSPLIPVVLLDQPDGTYWDDVLRFLQKQLVAHHYILPSDLKLMNLVRNANDAAQEIARFYRNFHSSRWLKEHFVIRMNHPLNENALHTLQTDFHDLCLTDGFWQQPCCDNERDEPEFANMMRLAFQFNDRDHGRLRELVDFINLPQSWA